MAFQSINVIELWKELSTLTLNSCNEIDNGLQEQALRLDAVYNKLLQAAQKEPYDYLPQKKISKVLSRKNGQSMDDKNMFAEPSFQPPAVPPIRRTKRQASIVATDKIKSVRESATISSGASTRASRARALSTFMDIDTIECPKANSTFVVDKKKMEDIEECLSPLMFSPEIKTDKKPTNLNATYNMPIKSSATNASVENSNPVSVKVDSKKKSLESLVKNKRREKLEDIDVNVELQHMTRTMKRKLQEENQTVAKKTNGIQVPLEKQISTPLKPIEEVIQTPHQVRENEAEKRKEMHLKSKADQRKNDDHHLKVAKQREEQRKLDEERIKKIAEEKKKKEEKQKQKEIMLKEEALKKQKQAELRLAEINAKRKQAEEAKLEAKLLKIQKAEKDRLLKENEIKKKNELKTEKSKLIQSKVGTSNIPTSLKKVSAFPKSKTENAENKNDYGLNDVSARDSSEDESGPKKVVPSWSRRENRKPVLELQYHVDSEERDLFFDCPKTMSLKEMFKGWNIRDRQRTSSAVWNTPPRYSEYIRRN